MASDPHFTQADPRHEARPARTARLEMARGELAEASGRGEGGRHAMRQYSHRMDALIQQLYADAGSLTQSVAVLTIDVPIRRARSTTTVFTRNTRRSAHSSRAS